MSALLGLLGLVCVGLMFWFLREELTSEGKMSTGNTSRESTSTSRTGSYELSADAFKASGSDSTLIVGTGTKFEPMFDTTDTVATGFDIDLARELALRLNKDDVRFISTSSARREAENGRVDLAIAAISITPQRLNENLFSLPYMESEFIVIANIEYKGQISAGNLSQFSCVVGPNGVYSSQLERTGCNKSTEKSTLQAVDSVASGIAAFTVIDQAYKGDLKNPNLFRPGISLSTDSYGVVMQLGNLELKKAVDVILVDLNTDGTIKTLRRRYGFD